MGEERDRGRGAGRGTKKQRKGGHREGKRGKMEERGDRTGLEYWDGTRILGKKTGCLFSLTTFTSSPLHPPERADFPELQKSHLSSNPGWGGPPASKLEGTLAPEVLGTLTLEDRFTQLLSVSPQSPLLGSRDKVFPSEVTSTSPRGGPCTDCEMTV